MTDMVDDLYEDVNPDREEEDYPECPFLRETCPRIHDFIRFDRYKGKPRKNGSFSVTVEGPLWVVRITDKDRERSFSTTGLDLASCLSTLDQLVASRQIHWHYWGNPTNGDVKKKVGMKK